MEAQVSSERQEPVAVAVREGAGFAKILTPSRLGALVAPIGRAESLVLMVTVAVMTAGSLWEPATIVFRWDATSRMIAEGALTLSFACWVASFALDVGLARQDGPDPLSANALATAAVVRISLVVGTMLLLLSAKGTNACAVAVAMLWAAETGIREFWDRHAMRAGKGACGGSSRPSGANPPVSASVSGDVPNRRDRALSRWLGAGSVGWMLVLAFTPVGAKGASVLGFQSGRGLVAIAILSHVLLVQGGGLLVRIRQAAGHRWRPNS